MCVVGSLDKEGPGEEEKGKVGKGGVEGGGGRARRVW
jgi:hypothetical protein